LKPGISAMVTAYERIEQTLATLGVIHNCHPRPNEILVHVDANQVECENAVRNAFPDVRILRSNDRVGPGGGRNKLLGAARFEYVASFDDDSYPIDSDYFERALKLSIDVRRPPSYVRLSTT
jgi:GT2 family glycosyltransferase